MIRILLTLLFLPVLCLQAQQVPTVDQYYPPPPNAASMAKYGEIPVDNFTGVANISIPLHTIQEGDLTVPISLNYHTGGIKVTEIASWAGLGWALNAGGSITRQVNGSIDEGGYFSNNIRSEGWYEKGNFYTDEYHRMVAENIDITTEYGCNYDPIPSQQAYPPPYYENISNSRQYAEFISKGYYDVQPDIFYLNIPGYSGKFYFNDNQEPILDPFQNIKIEPVYEAIIPTMSVAASRFTYFKVTTPDGTKYFFGGDTSGQNPNALDRTFSSGFGTGDVLAADQIVNSWHLVKIESVNGDYSINFTYEKQKFVDFTYNGSTQYSKVFFPPVVDDLTKNVSMTVTEEAVLSNIESTHCRMDFIRTVERKDLLVATDLVPYLYLPFSGESPKLLDEINITVNGICEKKYELNHTDFPLNNEENSLDISLYNPIEIIQNPAKHNYARQRPRLNSLRQIPCDSNSGEDQIHEFDYNDDFDESSHRFRLPSRLSFRQDHWGYYNFNQALEDTHIFPDLASIPEAVVPSGLDDFVHDINDFYRDDITSDKSANHAYSNAFLLTNITYPSGAVTEIETEGNEITKMEYSPNAEVNIRGPLRNCTNLFSTECCDDPGKINLTGVNIPPVNTNGSNITYHTLEAKIKAIPNFFGCNENNNITLSGLLVVKKNTSE